MIKRTKNYFTWCDGKRKRKLAFESPSGHRVTTSGRVVPNNNRVKYQGRVCGLLIKRGGEDHGD